MWILGFLLSKYLLPYTRMLFNINDCDTRSTLSGFSGLMVAHSRMLLQEAMNTLPQPTSTVPVNNPQRVFGLGDRSL